MGLWNNYTMKNYDGDDLSQGLHKLFTDNSLEVAANNEFYVNYSSDEPIKINQWLYTIEAGEAKFTFLPILHNKDRLIFPAAEMLTEESENAWCFIDNPGKGKRSKNRLERISSYHKPQLLYGAAHIFSRGEEEKFLIINNGHNPLPMKVWLNGILMFSCYRENIQRRSECVIKLNQGSNIIIVEREIIPQHKIKDMFMDTNFTISIYSLSYLLQNESGHPILGFNLFRRMQEQVDFITPKKMFQVDESIPYYLMAHNNFVELNYKVLIFDMNGTEVYRNNLCILQNAEILLDKTVHGILQILVLNAERIITIDYLLIGSIKTLLTKDGNTKYGNTKYGMTIYTEELINILDFGKNVVKDSIYPIDCNAFFHVFQNLYCMWNTEGAASYYQLRMVDTHDLGKKKNIGVLLPADYNPKREYPLVIQYIAGYGSYAIPGLNGDYPSRGIRNQNFKDIILAVIPCDFENFNIYELLAVGDIYNFLISEYSVAKQRVSLIGFCGSANSCIKVLAQYPDIFSAAALLTPYMDENALDNKIIQQVEDFHLHIVLNPSTGLFLPGIRYLENYGASATISPSIGHEELFAIYLNEELILLISQYEKKKTAGKIENLKQSLATGISSIYTKKCNILVDSCEEDEIPIRRELLLSMQLSKNKSSNIHIGKLDELNARDDSCNNIIILGHRQINEKSEENVINDIGCFITREGIHYRNDLFRGDTFLVAISENHTMCYVIYTSFAALEELRNLWENIFETPLFYRDYILWNEGKYL